MKERDSGLVPLPNLFPKDKPKNEEGELMGKKKITKRRFVAFPGKGKMKGTKVKLIPTANIKTRFARKFHKLEARPRSPRIEGKSFFKER